MTTPTEAASPQPEAAGARRPGLLTILTETIAEIGRLRDDLSRRHPTFPLGDS